MLEMKDTYDNSCYDKSHFLYDPTNNKTIGKFKDETVNPIIEFVGLRSKLYSCLIETPDSLKEKKTAKGVKSCIIKNKIRHENYFKCLFNSSCDEKQVEPDKMQSKNDMLLFKSKLHNISTVNVNKISMSSFDNKRYILNDGHNTLAYGSCLIRS